MILCYRRLLPSLTLLVTPPSHREAFFGRLVRRPYDLCIFLRFVLQFCILHFAFCITRQASATRALSSKTSNFYLTVFGYMETGDFLYRLHKCRQGSTGIFGRRVYLLLFFLKLQCNRADKSASRDSRNLSQSKEEKQ